MLSTQAPPPIAERLKDQAAEFFAALKHGEDDTIWNTMITPEAATLLSATVWPSYAYNADKIDALLSVKVDAFPDLPIQRGLALAFQMNLEDMRAGWFKGVANGLEKAGWFAFSREDCIVFLEDEGAILTASTPDGRMMLPFVPVGGGAYKVDLEGLQVFTLGVKASALFTIGKRCVELGLGLKEAIAARRRRRGPHPRLRPGLAHTAPLRRRRRARLRFVRSAVALR